MARDPDARYASCRELSDSLQLYLDGRFPISCPSTALKRWVFYVAQTIDNHPKLAVLSVIVALLTAVMAVVALLLY